MAAALIITLGGCATKPAGSAGVDAFLNDSTPVGLTGPRAAHEAARCFEEQGRFLPLSEFSRDARVDEFTYRLRWADLWFEQVRITPDGGGARAELRVAPGLDARWLTRLEHDRVGPLRRCLGS